MTPSCSEPEEPRRGHTPRAEIRTPAIERLNAMIEEEQRAAARIMDTPVKGPRGQQMTLTDAATRAVEIGNRIDLDEARSSLRHRTVGRSTKLLTVAFLAVIDLPIMLWLSSSVFNVDWAAPLDLPLAISLVISLLGTAGAAWTLHHLGHNRRENKTDNRQINWSRMSVGAKTSMAGVALLIALIAVVMFVRVYTEGVLSGLAELALLLAVLVAFIMLLSAALVFGTSFRDGSPEQDDLAHYSKLAQAGLQRKREHEDRAARLRHERDMLIARALHSWTGDGAAATPRTVVAEAEAVAGVERQVNNGQTSIGVELGQLQARYGDETPRRPVHG
jgi:hypothetical protein